MNKKREENARGSQAETVLGKERQKTRTIDVKFFPMGEPHDGDDDDLRVCS